MNPDAKIDDMLSSLGKMNAMNSGAIPGGPVDANIEGLVRSKIAGLLTLKELSDLQAAILKSLLEYDSNCSRG